MYNCGRIGCLGHVTPDGVCGKIIKYVCGVPNCPGHLSEWGKCIGDLYGSSALYSKKKYVCINNPTCPGHESSHQACI